MHQTSKANKTVYGGSLADFRIHLLNLRLGLSLVARSQPRHYCLLSRSELHRGIIWGVSGLWGRWCRCRHGGLRESRGFRLLWSRVARGPKWMWQHASNKRPKIQQFTKPACISPTYARVSIGDLRSLTSCGRFDSVSVCFIENQPSASSRQIVSVSAEGSSEPAAGCNLIFTIK